MPFIPIENSRGRRTEDLNVRCYVNKAGNVVYFCPSAPLMRVLGWNYGDRIVVSAGIAEDIGKVSLTRVERKAAGQIIRRTNMSYRGMVAMTLPRMIAGFPRHMILDGLPSAFVAEHVIAGDQLVLDLPRPRIRVVAAEGAA